MTTDRPDIIPSFAGVGASRTSGWIVVTQEMISAFGAVTLDPDPMHIDPAWAARHGPFGGAIAFGFLTISLLSAMLFQGEEGHLDRDPGEAGLLLNYGFDRLRLVAPVPAGARIRGRFTLRARELDAKGRYASLIDTVVEVEGSERPALVAEWRSLWAPPVQ